MTTRADTDATVKKALAMIRAGNRKALKAVLHPYLRWTSSDGRSIHGRTNVLAYLATASITQPPRDVELRDEQIYRWLEP